MLYQMLRTLGYALLLGTALWGNRTEPRMLMLTSVVGASIFLILPVPSTATLWYTECLFSDVLVAFVALSLRAPASISIVLFSLLLSLLHIVGICVGPQPGFGAYRVGVPILEYAELLACLLLSHPARVYIQRLHTKESE